MAAQSAELATGAVRAGTSHFLTSEDDGRTYRVTLEADGKLSSAVFNERGGTSVVTDVAGNVYIAGDRGLDLRSQRKAGRAFSRFPSGPAAWRLAAQIGARSIIAARTSLYSIRTKTAGR